MSTDSGFVPVLIETTSVIDLSISPEGLTAQLLQHIMAVERREYEGQWRSIEGDIHNQEAMLQQAEVSQGNQSFTSCLLVLIRLQRP